MALVVMNVKNQQLRRTIYCFVIKHYTFLKYPISTAQKCIHWHVLLQAIIKINNGKVLHHTTKASIIANLQWKKLPNCYFLLQIYIFVWIWCISFLQLITVQNGLKMYAKCVRVWCAYLLTLIHSIHSFVCSFRPSVSMRNFLLCNTKRSNLRDEKLKRDIQRSAAKEENDLQAVVISFYNYCLEILMTFASFIGFHFHYYLANLHPRKYAAHERA